MSNNLKFKVGDYVRVNYGGNKKGCVISVEPAYPLGPMLYWVSLKGEIKDMWFLEDQLQHWYQKPLQNIVWEE